MEWLLGGGAVVVVIAAVAAWVVIVEKTAKAKRDRVQREGRRLQAWIVPTVIREMENFYLFMIVFTFDESIPDTPAFLESVASRMVALTGREQSAGERNVARLITDMDSFELYTSRLRLPESLTDGREVYCTKTYARKGLLPDGKLSRPYIHVHVHPDVHDLKAEMVAYSEQ